MEFVILFMLVLLATIFLKMKSQVNQINILNKLLYIDKKPENYINKIDDMLTKKQSPKNLIINNIQKTTGLLYAGRFEEVIYITNEINKMPKDWEPIYYQNLILSLLFTGQTKKAEVILEKEKPLFEEFIKNSYYKEFIDIVYGVADFYKGIGSKDYFVELAETGANDYRKSFGYYFLGKIYKLENNMNAAKENFNIAMEYGKGSFIEEFAKSE